MKFRLEIEAAAKAYGLDPDLVQAIVERESSGMWFAYRYEPAFWNKYLATNPTWRGHEPREVSASYGLMQVMYTTAVENGFQGKPWDMFRPEIALDNGCRHFSKLLKYMKSRYTGPAIGSEEKILMSALAAYNGGKSGNLPDETPDRNVEYANSVMAHLKQLKNTNKPT